MRYTRFVQDVGAQHCCAPTTVPHLKGKRYKLTQYFAELDNQRAL